MNGTAPDPDDTPDLEVIEDLVQRALGGELLDDVLARLPSDVAREADVLLAAQSLFAGAATPLPRASKPDFPSGSDVRGL